LRYASGVLTAHSKVLGRTNALWCKNRDCVKITFWVFSCINYIAFPIHVAKYFGIRPMDEQISAHQSKFYLRYFATESAVSCNL